MAQDNVELFRRVIEAFDRRDREAWLALHDQDYELIPSATFPEAHTVRGSKAGWDYYVKATEPFRRRAFGEGLEVVTAWPDKVLVHHRVGVRGRASGAAVELEYWVVVTFREGKVLRDQWFTDRAEALDAAALAASA